MKKTSLTTAVIAGLAGVAGITNMASAVNLSTDGTGSVLIYPYYTVNAGNATLLSVVNTTSEGKAVKVRFLEAYNSREVLDFNLYLSPFDVWTAEIDKTGDGASVTTSDVSCTVPYFTGTAVAFRNNAYAGSNADTGPTGLDRTREGYVEMIEMGTVNDNTSGSLSAITHGGGTPDCAQVVNAWGNGGYWNADPTIDLGVPDGGLFGSGSVINGEQGTIEGYNADAIEGFYDVLATTAQHTPPGSVNPNLADGANPVAYTFNTSGTGATSLATTTFTASIDAVSAVFMTDNVYNEYVVDPAYGESTEWVITFPTKRFYVDTQIVGGTALQPFDEVFGENIDGASCAPVSITPYDREENTTTTPLDFSPPPTTAGNALCWEANVVTFDQSGTSSAILGSGVVANVNLPSSFLNGWVNIGFAGTNHQIQGTNGNTFFGLPATGFAVEEHINANVSAGILANYTGLYNHKYNRLCSNAGGACS